MRLLFLIFVTAVFVFFLLKHLYSEKIQKQLKIDFKLQPNLI